MRGKGGDNLERVRELLEPLDPLRLHKESAEHRLAEAQDAWLIRLLAVVGLGTYVCITVASGQRLSTSAVLGLGVLLVLGSLAMLHDTPQLTRQIHLGYLKLRVSQSARFWRFHYGGLTGWLTRCPDSDPDEYRPLAWSQWASKAALRFGQTDEPGPRLLCSVTGIDYTGHPRLKLDGAIRDAERARDFFAQLGVDTTDRRRFAFLTDRTLAVPTGQVLRMQMSALVGAARPGDALFWECSAHGAFLLPDASEGRRGPENQTDECMVPYDVSRGGEVITDREASDLLLRPLVGRGARLLAVHDLCNCGRFLRLRWVLWVTPYVPVESEVFGRPKYAVHGPGRPGAPRSMGRFAGSRGRGAVYEVWCAENDDFPDQLAELRHQSAQLDVMYLAMCRADEPSAEVLSKRADYERGPAPFSLDEPGAPPPGDIDPHSVFGTHGAASMSAVSGTQGLQGLGGLDPLTRSRNTRGPAMRLDAAARTLTVRNRGRTRQAIIQRAGPRKAVRTRSVMGSAAREGVTDEAMYEYGAGTDAFYDRLYLDVTENHMDRWGLPTVSWGDMLASIQGQLDSSECCQRLQFLCSKVPNLHQPVLDLFRGRAPFVYR